MGGHKHTRERDDSLCLRASPKENLILTHYILSAWQLHLLDVLGHYAIHLDTIAKILVTTNNIMDLGYTYAKLSLKNPLDVFSKFHTSAD